MRALLFLTGALGCCALARVATSDAQALFDLTVAGAFGLRAFTRRTP